MIKPKFIAAFLLIAAYFAVAAFAQVPVTVFGSGTNKGKFNDSNVVTANSGTTGSTFASGTVALTANTLAGRLLGSGTLIINSTGTIGSAAFVATGTESSQVPLNSNLGSAAYLSTGTAAGTVAAGNDSRIVGALSASGGTATGLTINGSGTTFAGSNVIYVSKAAQATDARTGLSKYDVTRPFATLTAAQSAAVSGDLIAVLPGTYAESNIAKNGVNWHFAPGAIVSVTGTTSIFSDASGAMAFIVEGSGDFRTNGNASTIRLVNSSSEVRFACDSISNTNAGGSNTEDSGIWHVDGTLYVWAKKISGKNSAIYWQGGTEYIFANLITSPGIAYYGLDVTADDHAYVTCDVLLSETVQSVEMTGLDPSAGLWITAKKIVSQASNAIKAVNCKIYVNAQKAEVAMASTDYGGSLVFEDCSTYLTIQKIEVLDSSEEAPILSLGAGGKSFIEIGEILNGGSDALTAVAVSGAGVHNVSIQKCAPSGNAVDISGGTLRLDSTVLDSSAGAASNPIVKSGGTLILAGVTMIASGTQKCIEIPTNQTVKVYSAFANTPASTAHTLTQQVGTITVSSDVQ